MKTYILAPSVRAAHEWCIAHDVQRYAKSTVIISTPDATRGHAVRPGDRVINIGASAATADAWRWCIPQAGRQMVSTS